MNPTSPPQPPSKATPLLVKAVQAWNRDVENIPALPESARAVLDGLQRRSVGVLTRVMKHKIIKHAACYDILLNNKYYNGTWAQPSERTIRKCLWIVLRHQSRIDTHNYIAIFLSEQYLLALDRTLGDATLSAQDRRRVKASFSEMLRNMINSLRIEDILRMLREYRY